MVVRGQQGVTLKNNKKENNNNNRGRSPGSCEFLRAERQPGQGPMRLSGQHKSFRAGGAQREDAAAGLRLGGATGTRGRLRGTRPCIL